MKPYHLSRVRYLSVLLFLFLSVPVVAQFRTAQLAWFNTPVSSVPAVEGYYESLPADYTGTTDTYPLIVYLHGDESVADSYTKILTNGLPKWIADGGFPEQFKVTGRNYSFIVIAPHYTNKELTPEELDKVINSLLNKYRVDESRIYLTGMSRGGARTWSYAGANADYANKLAAIVPVAGAEAPNETEPVIIGQSDLPVWATHNRDDQLVLPEKTELFVAKINEQDPKPEAISTIFDDAPAEDAHDAWTKTYDPDFKYKGRNIYEWMLQYRSSVQAPLPVTLGDYKALRSQNGVTITWTTASEINNEAFILERSGSETGFIKIATLPAAGQSHTYVYTDEMPLPGVNFYRLSQVDVDGGITYFPALSVNFDGSRKHGLTLYPNPVTDGSTLLELAQSDTGPVLFSVFNAGGLLARQWTVQIRSPFWRQPVSFSNLPSGSYVLQARSITASHTVTFVKR